MLYCDKLKKITSGLILLLVCAVLLSAVCIPVMEAEAAVTGNVAFTTGDFDESVGLTKVEGAAQIQLKQGTAAGYVIDFDTEPTTVNITTGSYAASAGVIEVRLDSATGPLLASFKTGTTQNWSDVTETAKIDTVFKGKHTIWFVATSGTQDFKSFGFWIPGANAGRYPSWPGVDNYDDISGSEYREEINMLKGMKVFGDADEETQYRGKIAATRAEFAVAMANLFETDGGTEAAEIFRDITKDDSFCEAVTELLNLNIIKADKNKFRPADYITFDEAAQWMTSALGLDYQVKTKNLRRVISDMKLFYDIKEEGKYVTREQMARLLVNVIQADNAVISELMPNDWYKYEAGDGILAYQGIYRGRGIAEANGYFSLDTNETPVSKAEVIIDGESYDAGKTNAPNYVGHEVDFLWKKSNGVKTIVGIMTSENDETLILDSQAVDFTEISESIITYYADEKADKEKEIELDAGVTFFYNDKLIDKSLAELMGSEDASLFDGTIQFISNDGHDDDYEIVKIYQMESIIFGGYSGNTIYDSLREEAIPFDSMDELLIYDNGSLAEVAAIPYGTVLDVYRSKNDTGARIFRADFSYESFEGYITEIDSDGDITLDNGRTYKKYHYYTKELSVGQEGRFLINSYGKILGAEAAGADYYGLMKGAGLDDPTGFNGGTVMIKLYPLAEDAAEEEIAYSFADKVWVDGVRTESHTDVYNAVSAVSEYQPVRYRLDGDGHVSLIDTTNTVKGDLRDCLTAIGEAGGEKVVYGNVIMNNICWDGVCPVAKDVAWVQIYTNAGEPFIFRSVGAKSSTDSINISAYSTVLDGKEANIIVQTRSGVPAADNEKTMMVVTEILNKSENGETYIYVKGARGTKSVEFKVDKRLYEADADFKNKIDGLEKGDLISPYVSDNLLTDLVYIFMGDGKDASETGVAAVLNKTKFHTNGTNRTTQGVYYHGEVIDRKGDFIKLQCGEDKTEWVNTAGKSIIVCEEDGRIYSVENGKGNQYLGVGEHVFAGIRPWAYTPDVFVVYRSMEFGD